MDRWPAAMSASEAAQYLGICRTAFDRHVRAGRIRFVQPNQPGWRMFRRTDLDAYLSSLESLTA